MRRFVGLSVIATVAVLAPATARAHFTLDQLDDFKPVSWMSQDANGGPQKAGPCAATVANGDPMGTPTHIVTGLIAGETVKITVTATVAHPGWYRIALMEGASASQSLTTIPDPMAMSGTNCTPAILTNPVWSKTQPVIADGLPAGSTAKTMQSGTKVLTATIPQNASCTTAAPCTIQVIMVMTDHPANDCYYHHCADITTDGGGNGDAGTPDARDGGMSSGGGNGGSAMGGAAAGGAKGSGGVTGTGGAVASGGVSGSGGATSSGGASATASGGVTATGGTSSSSGGITASGGKTGSGGSSSGSGGSSSGSGGTTVAGSGGSSSSGASGSSGGCSAIPGTGGAPFIAGGASLLALLVARARRRRK